MVGPNKPAIPGHPGQRCFELVSSHQQGIHVHLSPDLMYAYMIAVSTLYAYKAATMGNFTCIFLLMCVTTYTYIHVVECALLLQSEVCCKHVSPNMENVLPVL